MNEFILKFLRDDNEKQQEIRVHAVLEEEAIKKFPKEFRLLSAYPVTFLLISKEKEYEEAQ